jgi:transmembrane sensor
MGPKTDDLEAGQAARWYVRLRAADCALSERLAFQRWLAQDPGHERAYSLVKAAAARVDALAAADPRLQAMAAEALGRPATADAARLPKARWRTAAALVVGVGLAAALTLTDAALRHQRGPMVASYSNAGAERQLVTLSDGSIVHLDVGASLDVKMAKSARRLQLRSGRAFFEVAHDATRPFSVQAGDSRTVALGTRFEVELAPQGVTVTLAEGSVAITPVANPAGWREVLKPGEQLQLAASGGDRAKREIDAMAVVSWSQGRLVFKGTPLADALDEINRYAAVKLHLGDSSLASFPVGGSFVAGGDTEQVVAALAAILPLRAVHVGASEIVLFRQYETAGN